jgi:hypothetical protein
MVANIVEKVVTVTWVVDVMIPLEAAEDVGFAPEGKPLRAVELASMVGDPVGEAATVARVLVVAGFRQSILPS